MKTKILEKVEYLFWENSFAEVSMDEVAKKLGMKKASVYYHFPSKEKMFIEILEFSFSRYKSFLEELLLKIEIEKTIIWIISYPIESKNLFSIVSQKWYCKIESIKNLIIQKNTELFQIFYKYFKNKYWFNEEKTVLLQSVLNDLSKKYCIFDCKESLDLSKLVPEIVRLFFK